MSASKTKKKIYPKSIHEMSKEMLEETLKKKKECNEKAQKIVEMLCEVNIDEKWFLENLQFINQCHFEDVTVERSITKLCGYPLCDGKLEKVPSQQYHISTKYNKVFDITERKNFCSSSCYKAALFVKSQLFTSPLWFRDQEVIPKYDLIKSPTTGLESRVDFPTDKIKVDNRSSIKTVENNVGKESDNRISKTNSVNSVPVVSQTNNSVNEKGAIDSSDKSVTDQVQVSNPIQQKVNQLGESTVTTDADILKEEPEKTSQLHTDFNNLNISEQKCDDHQKEPNGKHGKQQQHRETVHNSDHLIPHLESHEIDNSDNLDKSDRLNQCVEKVEKCILEWFSVDTLLFLYKEEKLKKLFSDKADALKAELNSKLSTATFNERIEKMVKLYSYFEKDVFDSDSATSSLKPLPDYSILQQEGKNIDIKVRAFYNGQLDIRESEKQKSEKPEQSNQTEIYLPLVDSHSQNALRRQILLKKLNRLLPELLRIFTCDYTLPMNEIRQLVATFSLAAHNITFKPLEWNLVGIILLKLYSVKDKYLNIVLNLESSEMQLSTVMESFKLKPNYLNDFIDRLVDPQNVIKKF